MKKASVRKDVQERDGVALTPLAIPMLAGPGSISLMIGMQEKYGEFSDRLIVIMSVLVACLATFAMLKCAHFIVKFLGASGINAISRIIGFIVIAIGIEFISVSMVGIFG